jgi:hypothetical protein
MFLRIETEGPELVEMSDGIAHNPSLEIPLEEFSQTLRTCRAAA